MSLPYNENSLDTILRLGSLKNVSGRRKVLPGAQFNEQMEEMETDLGGVSDQPPESPVNMPSVDVGAELSPQSFDVRANQVNVPPSPEEEPSMFHRIGKAVANYVRGENTPEFSPTPEAPPVETAEVDMQEGLPAVTASEQESPGFFQSLADEASKPWHNDAIPKLAQGTKEYFKKGYQVGLDPAVYDRNPALQKPDNLVQQEQAQQQIDHQALDEAQMNPGHVVAYGATDAFANNPQLIQSFQEYTGIDFNPQIEEMTKKYEAVLSGIDKGLVDDFTGLDEQSARIKERILKNQATDADKYYIGLALLMPLLVGAVFGKEAALGALGGSGKGLSETLLKREDAIRKDEESLSDIYKQRSTVGLKRQELELEKLKIPSEIKKLLPKDDLEDLKGMKIGTFKDPNTNEIIASGPEILPDLYADLQYANTEEKRKDLREKAYKLAEEKTALEKSNQATSNLIHVAMQLKDPSLFARIVSLSLAENGDGALKKLVQQEAPELMIDGRLQNAATYIDSNAELLKDAYRRNEQMKAFTTTVANHLGDLAQNPLYTGMKPRDLSDQMQTLRDRAQKSFVDRAAAQGFLREPLESKFGQLNKKLYDSMNANEDKKQLKKDKLKLYSE